MPACSPQRYVANNRNALLAATLVPSSVMPVANKVLELPVGRNGTGAVIVEGSFTGEEAALYDIEIVDESSTNPVVTAPVATGAGSGTLENIQAYGTPQEFTVELQNDGVPTLRAGVSFEGVRIVARTPGAGGNVHSIEIDRSGLVFTPSTYSLIEDLPVASGGPTNGVEGAQYDWDAKVLSGDNIIPADAHRIAFGEDTTNIYLAYKKYTEGEWRYHFVPAIKREVKAGTIVNFVTGSRTVIINDGDSPAPESFAGIVTVYDMLNAIKTTSTLLDVVGIVAYDRSPTGQAAREVLLRTDAHTELSSGSGSKFAKGFVETAAYPDAATELVTAECFAVSSSDHPQARVGKERWRLRGSVSGNLGEIVTNELFDNGRFALKVPQRLPESITITRGRFTHTGNSYVPREEEEIPPICPKSLGLGPNAVNQTITLEWTKRPSGDCGCESMPAANLSAACLGTDYIVEGDTVGFKADTVTRLSALYAYAGNVATQNSGSTTLLDGATVPVPGQFLEGAQEIGMAINALGDDALEGQGAAARNTENFSEIIDIFARTLMGVDPVSDATLHGNALTAWDAAFSQIQSEVSGSTPSVRTGVDSNKYKARMQHVYAAAGLDPVGKSEASTLQSGDGCWQDMGGDYFTVVGSELGAYAPAFPNSVYYASRLAENGRQFFSTKEFAFLINIKCPELLVYGDRVTFAIGDAGLPSTYQIGDILTLPVIAGQNLQFSGGQDGNAILQWYVSGSVDGALPNFVFNPNAPSSYLATGILEFTYVPGGIPNRAGDRFTFALEGARYRWRKNGGAWVEESPLAEISTTPEPLDAGLTLRFAPGASPSYVAGDIFSFRALQPWAVSNLKTPGAEKWRWSGTGASVVADLGTEQAIPDFTIARHTLPVGATVLLEGGTAPGVYLWSEPITRREGVMFTEFASPPSARYLRVTIANATDAAIGWMHAGVAEKTTLSADVQIRPAYRIESGSGTIDQGGRYLARAHSGNVRFEGIALDDPDVAKMIGMIDWAKRRNDEPIVLVPNVLRPEEAYLVQWGVDEFAFEEWTGHNATPNVRDRRYAIDIPVTGVWQA